MKQVTRYEAEDGSIFDDPAACQEYEFRKRMENRIYEELRHADPEEIYNWIIHNTKGFKDGSI